MLGISIYGSQMGSDPDPPSTELAQFIQPYLLARPSEGQIVLTNREASVHQVAQLDTVMTALNGTSLYNSPAVVPEQVRGQVVSLGTNEYVPFNPCSFKTSKSPDNGDRGGGPMRT